MTAPNQTTDTEDRRRAAVMCRIHADMHRNAFIPKEEAARLLERRASRIELGIEAINGTLNTDREQGL